MANQILQTLLFNIESNTAQLKQGLDQAKNQISSFGKGVQQIGTLLKGAFAATAIIGAAKGVYDFGQELEGIRDKVENLGYTMDTAFSTAKAKAIADVFEVDIDKVITAANATAKQFGVSFNDALQLTQEGLALAGTESLKYLKAIEANAAAYSTAGGSAEQYFTVVTNGFATSNKWEDQIKNGITNIGKSWGDLTGNMTEGQQVQQRLINSTAELNKVFVDLFDGSGDGIDKLKTSFNEIAVVSIKAIKKGIIDVSNYFIELFNNSVLFRGIIQAVVLNFQIMWNVVKAIASTLVDAFMNAGALLKAVLTGNFEEIPNIIKKAFEDSVSNVKDFASNTADAFKDGVQAVLFAKPIELISETDAVQQGIKAGNAIKKGIASTKVYASVNPRSNISDVDISQATLQQPKIDTKAVSSEIETLSTQTAGLQTQYEQLDTTFSDTLSGTFVDSLDAAGQAMAGFSEDGKGIFSSFVGSILGGIKKIINGLLAQAIASALAGQAVKGFVGLATAAVLISALTSQFASIQGKFANGGVSNGGVALVGERGRELVNLPSGSRVANNFQTERMLGGGALQLQAVIRGEDIYLSYNQTAKNRGNSI